MCQVNRVTQLMAFSTAYQIIQTTYLTWVSLGFCAFAFSLVGHLPFLLSFVRMWWRDTESSRLIFYRSSMKTWMFTIAIDLWSAWNLYPLSNSQCQAINAYEYSSDTGWDWFSDVQHMNQCELQVRLTRLLFYLLLSDVQFALLVVIARRNWQMKRRSREKCERTYLHAIKKC